MEADKHIPIPKTDFAKYRLKYDLSILKESGDSYFYEGKPRNISAVVSIARKKTGKNYVVRYTKVNGKEGARIWLK